MEYLDEMATSRPLRIHRILCGKPFQIPGTISSIGVGAIAVQYAWQAGTRLAP
jgi:hypothetical protein